VTYILIPADGLVDIARRKLVQLLVVTKDDNRDVNRAKNRELVRLLEQTAFALEEGADESQYWEHVEARRGHTQSGSGRL
jgi:hypothetical protein